MEKWDGVVAVVTGASAGIGKAMAVKLAEYGLNVAALARRDDRLQELSETFKGKGSIKPYKCDVSNESNVEEVFKKIEKDMGRIRVLVNNAGVASFTPLIDFSLDKWRQMYDVNVFGMFSCIKQVFNSIKANDERKLVHIININSIAGHQPPSTPEGVVYASTKHAVTMLTKALLKQLTNENYKNIKVTSLSPGVVDTEIFGVGGWKKMDINKIAHLSPDEVAEGLISVLSASENVVISEFTIKPSGELF